jgi:hypothetical protein
MILKALDFMVAGMWGGYAITMLVTADWLPSRWFIIFAFGTLALKAFLRAMKDDY